MPKCDIQTVKNLLNIALFVFSYIAKYVKTYSSHTQIDMKFSHFSIEASHFLKVHMTKSVHLKLN